MIQTSIPTGGKKSGSRVILQPMEGCGCTTDGSPSELTIAAISPMHDRALRLETLLAGKKQEMEHERT